MPDAAKQPLKTYVVEGSKYGEFPLDMLRRDDALPYGEDQAALVDRLNAFGEGKADLPKTVRVTVASNSRFAPNVARWESFGWRVVECSDPTVMLSKPAPEVKFRDAVSGVEADFAEAFASLSPKQAWAVALALEVQSEVSRKMEKISPHQARQISAGEGIEEYVERTRREITAEFLRQEGIRAQERPRDLREVRIEIAQAFSGKRVGDTFQIGERVYATVSGPHLTQFTAVNDGGHIQKVRLP